MIRRLIIHTENRVKVYLSAEDLYELMLKHSSDYWSLVSMDGSDEQDPLNAAAGAAVDLLMYIIDAKMHGTFYPHKR